MTFVLIALGVLVALILIAVVMVPIFVDESALIALAQDKVREQTGGELVIAGDTALSLFPKFAIELNETQLTLPARDAYQQAIDARLDRLSLGLAVIPTLKGEPVFSALEIDGLHARITAPQAIPATPAPKPQMSDRDWERLGRSLRSEREAQRQQLLQAGQGGLALAIAADNLTIRDITLEMLSADGELETKIALQRLTMTDINTANRPVQFDTAASVQSSPGASPLLVEMTGVLRVPGDLSTISIDRIETMIEGALSEPVSATLTGSLALSPLVFSGDLTAALPGGEVRGDLRYAALESPQIDVHLESQRLDLDRLQPAASTTESASDQMPDTQVTATAPALPLPVGPLQLIDLALEVNAGQLLSAGQVIDNAQLGLRVRDAVADLNYLRGTLHEGQLDTKATFNARRLVAELSIEGGMKGINLDSLLDSLDTPDQVSGRVDMVWDINSRGATAEAIKLGLDGDFQLTGQDVVIEQVSLQGLMCDAISRVTNKPLTEEMPTSTSLSQLTMGIEFDQGQADIEELQLSTLGLGVAGDGAVALDTMNFELVLNSRIDKALETLDENCRVVDRYADIDWPIACRGNLQGAPQEWCGIDVNRIAEQLISNEAKSQIEKNAGKLFKKLFNN